MIFLVLLFVAGYFLGVKAPGIGQGIAAKIGM